MNKIIIASLLLFLFATPCLASVYSDIDTSRQFNGLPVLEVDKNLEKTAKSKVDKMREEDHFAHKSLKGICVEDIFISFKIKHYVSGEILAIGYKNPVLAWLLSPTHRSIIVDQEFNKIGCYTDGNYYACHFSN